MAGRTQAPRVRRGPVLRRVGLGFAGETFRPGRISSTGRMADAAETA